MTNEDIQMMFQLNAEAKKIEASNPSDPRLKMILAALAKLKETYVAELKEGTVPTNQEQPLDLSTAFENLKEAVSSFLRMPDVKRRKKPEEYAASLNLLIEAINGAMKIYQENEMLKKEQPKKSDDDKSEE